MEKHAGVRELERVLTALSPPRPVHGRSCSRHNDVEALAWQRSAVIVGTSGCWAPIHATSCNIPQQGGDYVGTDALALPGTTQLLWTFGIPAQGASRRWLATAG